MWRDLPPAFKKIIITTIIISVAGGGLIGGVVGSLGALWANTYLAPWLGEALPWAGGEADGLEKKNQVVVEDSATTDVVQKATGAVVSIIVTQDLSKLYNQTGHLSPFGDWFSFPSLGCSRRGRGRDRCYKRAQCGWYNRLDCAE